MLGSSWLALRDGTNDDGVIDPKVKLREEIAKGNLPEPEKIEPKIEDTDDDNDDDIDPDAVIKDPPEETSEQKVERENKEKIEAKAKRKTDRMQARIDETIAKGKEKDAEIARLKAQLEADPDKKLTEEEVQTRAEKIASDKLAAKNAADTNAKFDNACAKLLKDAIKIDKDFNDKVHDMAEQFGPIPSFMIGVLEDFENGAEVLAHIANDDDVAEKIYDLKSPAKMTKELVEISNKLIAAKKKPKKEISKVPDPVEPVNGSRHVSTVITEADTKDMDTFVAKRRAQQEIARKARGW